MKKTIGIFLLLFSVVVLNAEQIDLSRSEGTEQSIIASLQPQPASSEVDADVTVKVRFNEALDPMSVQRSVNLERLTEEKSKGIFGFGFSKRKKSEDVKGTITYDDSSYTVTFTPDQPLSVGFYKVSFRHLMTKKPGMHMRIKPIVYRFYVPEVINGFKLPPEPDEDKNNETLLGIDFNGNGIRDDVERWIITYYAQDPKYPKTKTAIALQDAWASQKILENPTMESSKYEDNALACEYYWFNKETVGLSGFEFGKFSKKHKVINTPELEDKIFNTKERILRSFEYNSALSGNILTPRENELSACRINIDELGE